MDAEAYQQYDGLGLAQLIRKQVVSPQDVLEAAIEIIEAKNTTLNAVTLTHFEQARTTIKHAALDAPFSGVPFLLKDMVAALQGSPTSCGSRYLSTFIWDHDSELVKRYRKAGLIIIGKTNVPEFGLSPSSENKTFGDTHNPWDVSHSAGGSSAGAAAAVASGMVPMAHGSDGGGSIRIPASCCGLFGLKPSRGRMPTGPDFGRLWQGLATDHALTRSVRDSAALLDIAEGPDVGAPLYAPRESKPYLSLIESAPKALKIAILDKPFFESMPHPAVTQAAAEAAKLCESMGHRVQTCDLSIPSEEVLSAAQVVMSSELAAGLHKFARITQNAPQRGDLEITTRVFYEFGRRHHATDFLKATQTFELLTREVARFFVDYDIVITPTLSRLPIALGELAPTEVERIALQWLARCPVQALMRKAIMDYARRIFDYIPYTLLFNITGQPAMSVPWTVVDKLPVGVQFAAGFGNDALLLQLARQIEIARPWFGVRPGPWGEGN